MALVQSASVFPATTTVVASTLTGLWSTSEVFNDNGTREERLGEENTFCRKRGQEIAEGDTSSKKIRSECQVSQEKTSPNTSAVMLPMCNGRSANLSPVDWQNAVAAGSIPKETIIAHTDFTHTSAIAKRRLRKHKLQSQNSTCSSDDDVSGGRSPTQISSPNEYTISPKISSSGKEKDTIHTSNVVIGSVVSMATSIPNPSPEVSKSILLQQTHLAQQQQQNHQQQQQQQQQALSSVLLPGGGVNGSIPVQQLVHTHNHTHTHMHHFAGGWPGQVLPLAMYPGHAVSPNKDKTTLPNTTTAAVYNPMGGRGYGYPVMYMVPESFLTNGSTRLSPKTTATKTTSQVRTSGVDHQPPFSTAGLVVPPPPSYPMLPGNPWPGIVPSHNTGNAAAAMVTGGIPAIGTVPFLGIPQMVPAQFPLTYAVQSDSSHHPQFTLNQHHKHFAV